MRPPPTGLRVAAFLTLYLALLAPGVRLDQWTLQALRPFLKMTVRALSDRSPVEVEPVPDASVHRGNGDTFVTVQRRYVVNMRHLCWSPLALLLALTIATPLPWRRRGLALAWGLGLLITLSLARTALVAMVQDEVYLLRRVLPPSHSPSGALLFLQGVLLFLASVPALGLLLAVVLWYAVAFRHTHACQRLWERMSQHLRPR